MAIRKKVPRKISSNVRLVNTATPYGIDQGMVVTDEDILSKVTVPADTVLVRDDQGIFPVPTFYLENSYACPARMDSTLRAKWDRIAEEQGIELPELPVLSNKKKW